MFGSVPVLSIQIFDIAEYSKFNKGQQSLKPKNPKRCFGFQLEQKYQSYHVEGGVEVQLGKQDDGQQGQDGEVQGKGGKLRELGDVEQVQDDGLQGLGDGEQGQDYGMQGWDGGVKGQYDGVWGLDDGVQEQADEVGVQGAALLELDDGALGRVQQDNDVVVGQDGGNEEQELGKGG